MSPITENALSHHRAGRLAEAETLYLAALDATPGDAEVLRLLSILRSQQGRADEALALAERAQRADPRSAKANATLASALQAAGRVEEALAEYERALALDPRQPETLFNRGIALDALGRPLEALASYDAALALRPEFAEALANRGSALQALGRIDEAIASYDRALALRPVLLEALNNRGTALQAAGRLAEAIASYETALAIRPDLPNVLGNLGTAYQAMERHAEAIVAYDRALVVDPLNADALANRGHALHLVGRHEEAMASVEKAVSVAPENVAARWSLAILQMPAVCDSEADAERSRGAFVSRLAELDRWLDSRRAAGAVDCVGDQHPFLLAYQDLNARDLMRGYGALCARVMAEWQARQSLPGLAARRVRAGPIRVGVASRFFYDQSVWTAIVKGWARDLDAGRFSLHFFHLGPAQDAETDYARGRAARFEQGKRGLRQWAEAILAEGLDVLIYPEIGMDPVTMKLASARLAPVQMTTWGHPLTSGLPTLDYFLSADDMEPASAQDHYTERLVRLPGLGCSYSPLAVEPRAVDADALGIGQGAPVLLCPGAPFKYAPEHDHVFPEIADRLGRCRFVFFTYTSAGLSERLARRLRRAFSKAGLRMDDFVVFVPWQARPSFYGLLQRADVFLDTIGFSGFNTAMQAIECGLPIVTREGRFLRGRLASGPLTRMGLDDLVARDDAGYIERAVRLCRDKAYRADTRARIERSRPVLFDDKAPVRALEAFLAEAVGSR